MKPVPGTASAHRARSKLAAWTLAAKRCVASRLQTLLSLFTILTFFNKKKNLTGTFWFQQELDSFELRVSLVKMNSLQFKDA